MLSKLISIILISLVRVYQWFISPIIPSACRYYPTCSHYMVDAIKSHGIFYGLWIGAKRLLRCNPFAGSGFDPVPKRIKLK